MNNNFDSMIKEAPSLTLDPFGADAKTSPPFRSRQPS